MRVYTEYSLNARGLATRETKQNDHVIIIVLSLQRQCEYVADVEKKNKIYRI